MWRSLYVRGGLQPLLGHLQRSNPEEYARRLQRLLDTRAPTLLSASPQAVLLHLPRLLRRGVMRHPPTRMVDGRAQVSRVTRTIDVSGGARRGVAGPQLPSRDREGP